MGDRYGGTSMSEHNHVTRDIKPAGVCPGCDEHIHWSGVRKVISDTIQAQVNHPYAPDMDASEIVRNLREAGVLDFLAGDDHFRKMAFALGNENLRLREAIADTRLMVKNVVKDCFQPKELICSSCRGSLETALEILDSTDPG